MLTSIRIQNFRSIRDASVKLGQVNLFIGPNNSGKSNFFKGIEFLADIISNYPADYQIDKKILSSYFFRGKIDKHSRKISGAINTNNTDDKTFEINAIETELDDINTNINVFEENNLPQSFFKGIKLHFEADEFIHFLKNTLNDCQLYDINPIFSRFNREIISQEHFAHDSSNIIPFLFTLSQNHRGNFRRLEKDLEYCLGNIVSVGTPIDPDESGKLRLRLFDNNDIGYWAEEVSEGVLYFLALLCIIHQPEPPKLLLLEEPEKGIHPRRIKEVMNLIFELARLRDIQIILTSHSPYVVDHFSDIPECISVFDRENGETVIHNAADLIEQTNKEYAEQGLPPISYKDSLGEYWLSGFLGGVPA